MPILRENPSMNGIAPARPGSAKPPSSVTAQSPQTVQRPGTTQPYHRQNGPLSGTLYDYDDLASDRDELHGLNSRLSVMLMRTTAANHPTDDTNTTSILNNVDSLNEELSFVKSNYDREINKIRSEIKVLVRARTESELENCKLRSQNLDLDNRLKQERARREDANAALDRIMVARSESTIDPMTLRQRRSVIDAVSTAATPSEAVENYRNRLDASLDECTQIRHKYEEQMVLKNASEEQVVHLQEKLAFDCRQKDQHSEKLFQRLQSATATIVALERRIGEATRNDETLPIVVQRMRQAADRELAGFKASSNQMFNSSLTELKVQLDEMMKRLTETNSQNRQLHSDAVTLEVTINNLRSQVTYMENEKSSIEQLLLSEREKSFHQITMLETQLSQLQTVLVTKMHELSESREGRQPLKSELETLRLMLDEEESRQHRVLTPTDFPAYTNANQPIAANEDSAISANKPTTTVAPLAFIDDTKITGNIYKTIDSGGQRSYSAPSGDRSSIGQHRDYFETLFHPNVKQHSTNQVIQNNDSWTNENAPPPLPLANGFNYNDNKGATGPLSIIEIEKNGNYIRVQNTNAQQITVWSADGVSKNDNKSEFRAPDDFIFQEHTRWGTSPEFVTMLCNPGGQAVAWSSRSHKTTPDVYNSARSPKSRPQSNTTNNNNCEEAEETKKNGVPYKPNVEVLNGATVGTSVSQTTAMLPEYNMDINGTTMKSENRSFLKRRKASPPSLNAQKHPHGGSIGQYGHPCSSLSRSRTYGNDNSSVNRQSRNQQLRPDPVPGAPYAGSVGQKMGSALLKKYNCQQHTTHRSGAISNKADDRGLPTHMRSSFQPSSASHQHIFTKTEPPSAFQTPHKRFDDGLKQLSDQHNTDFQPPMPKPPLFASW